MKSRFPPVLGAAHGQRVLVPDLVLFLGQHKPPTELGADLAHNSARAGLYQIKLGVLGVR